MPQPKAVKALAPVPAAPEGQMQTAQGAKPRGREAALARRALRCAGAQCWSDPKQRGTGQAVETVVAADPVPEGTVEARPAAATVEDAVFDAVCEIAESAPETLGWRDRSVRTLCKARRRSLAQRGKVAIPVRNGLISVAARQHYLETGSAREFARRHRRELAAHGRGSAEPARPTGRRRRQGAPAKVEADTTLAGSAVTGTQVHRAPAITGTEAGSCRTITGTEYLGAEHYTRFCKTQPEASPAKVRVGRTGGNVGVSGTYLGHAQAVTGDEAGTCRVVTGTEYMGGDYFQAACDTAAPARPPKVVTGRTARQQLPVSGSDEARMNRVTGSEPGAVAKITGSQYADGGAVTFR